MKKLYVLVLTAVLAGAAVSTSQAQILSYWVDVGAGFCNALVVGDGNDNSSTLTVSPVSGQVDVSLGAQDFDVANYLLSTDNPIGGPLDTITHNLNYTIEFFAGNFDPCLFPPAPGTASAIFTQTGTMIISNIREASASNNNPAGTIAVVAGPNTLGMPVNVTFKSLDVPGAPKSDIGPGIPPFLSVGAKTDTVTSVPEPGMWALLIGASVPLSMIRPRRLRKR